MGGCQQRLPTIEERLRVLEDECRSMNKLKDAVIHGLKELRIQVTSLEQAESVTANDLVNIKTQLECLDKTIINNSVLNSSPVSSENYEGKSELWLTQSQAIKVLNKECGFNLPLAGGISKPLIQGGYVEIYRGVVPGVRPKYKLTDKGREAGFLSTKGGNISVLESRFEELKKVVATYYRTLYSKEE